MQKIMDTNSLDIVCVALAEYQFLNKEAGRLYAELLLWVGWHTDCICFFFFYLFCV